MSTVLTAESARRAFSMVSLQKCHAQSRAATRHAAPRRAVPRPARTVVDLSTMRSFATLLSFSLSLPFSRSVVPVVLFSCRRHRDEGNSLNCRPDLGTRQQTPSINTFDRTVRVRYPMR